MMGQNKTMENKLQAVIKEQLAVILDFHPFKKFSGVKTKENFLKLINSDPAFSPFSLDNPKYVTARIGGNLITSLHRKLGDLYESMFKIILAEKLSVAEADLNFAIELNIDGKMQQRTTDGLIRFSNRDADIRERLLKFCPQNNPIGMAFEVRSCYQIGDSKRIQADRDMALALTKQKLEPFMLIFCSTSLENPVKRLSKYWNLYQGENSFDFIFRLTGFDLFKFLKDQKPVIDPIMKKIFRAM